VIDTPIPSTEHDVKVDVIVTPDEVIACSTPHRLPGILGDHLEASRIAAIPALQSRIQAG